MSGWLIKQSCSLCDCNSGRQRQLQYRTHQQEQIQMKKPATVAALEDLGRVRLSKHFFM
ncbi:hypothetical protein PXNS11_150173 [Stutzerimonas xanthomarina]|nr:hypothetical protein PXNS11_150173 [Stutzerimonas xanthomarina]